MLFQYTSILEEDVKRNIELPKLQLSGPNNLSVDNSTSLIHKLNRFYNNTTKTQSNKRTNKQGNLGVT